MKSLESRLRRFEEESDANGALNAKLQSETASLSSENVQLKKDMSWLANQAQQNKLQTEKAIQDLQAYTQILRGMERKLAETETQKQQL